MTRTETEIETCIEFYTHRGAADSLITEANRELDRGTDADIPLAEALAAAAGKHLAAAREIARARVQTLLHGKEI